MNNNLNIANILNVRYLYLLNAAVALILALGLLLVTPTMLDIFGISDSADTRLLVQLTGVELVAGGLVSSLANDVKEGKVRSALNYAYLSANGLGFVIALNGTFTGVLNPMGFLLVGICALLAIGFAYFQFFKPVMPAVRRATP